MKPREEENASPQYIIQPLDTMEDYNNLSVEERAKRQAAITNHFITFAINYSSRVRTSTDFLLKEVQEYKEVGNYSDSGDSAKKKEVALARKLVEADELCGTVLDRLVSFCITQGTIENVKNQKFLKVLNRWKESIGNIENPNNPNTKITVIKPHGINSFLSMIIERLLVDGDSIVSEIWDSKVELDGKSYNLPYKLNIHDTLLATIDDQEFVKSGQEKIYLSYPTDAYSGFPSKKTNTEIPLFTVNGEPFTTHMKLRAKTFNKWGTSYFKRSFHPVAAKKRIEALEVNTIEGLINRLTILKAGKIDPETESGIVAPHRLAILEQMIAQPKVNNFLLWPGDDISILDIGPDAGILTYEKKYAEANEQILAALGFPRVLVDGEGSSTENWQKFLGLISYIENIRNSILVPWMNQLLRKIAIKNGYNREYPRYTFSRIKLYDLKELLNAVKVFYDRGLMSELSAITSGDLDYDIEHSRRMYESEYGIIANVGGPKSLPFSKNSPDGTVKDGKASPEKTVDKPSEVTASINDQDRLEIVSLFSIYLKEIHDDYSKKVVKATNDKDYDKIVAILLAYYEHIKKIIKDQMFDLYSTEVTSAKETDKMFKASISWINPFIDQVFEDMGNELANIIEHNKTRHTLIPDLIAGVMAAFYTKRLSKYSSSAYNKAKTAGILTSMSKRGADRIVWKSALTERTCDWCGAMHDNVMSLEDFFSNFPPHPHCECWGESTELDYTDPLPKKDPKNWSRPLS